MRKTNQAGLDIVLAGGSDREGGGRGPLTVLFHGYGAPGEDLVPLYRALDVPSEMRFAFPAAPNVLPLPGNIPTSMIPAGFESRAWWDIDMVAFERALATGQKRMLAAEDPPTLPQVREQACQALDALSEELSVPDGQLYIGGFSQGSMLACDIAFSTSRNLAGLVILSGTLLAQDRWQTLWPSRSGLRVFQSHGQRDPILPFENAEALRDGLREAGLEVDWHTFIGGHEIPPTVLDNLGRFISS